MVKRAFVIVLVLFLIGAGQFSSVWACSGYPYFGIDDLPTMDLLVRATVIDADDRGYSAVIYVEEYYKGSGPRLLTVMRHPVALQSGAGIRGYDTSCLYSGVGSDYWMAGTRGYFGLKPNDDGTFTDYNGGSAHFYPVNGEIGYQEGATEGFAVELDDALSMSESEFIDLLLETGGRVDPVLPDETEIQRYPLMRWLDITTESGTRYQINPDRSVRQLPEDYPIAISPDGAHTAFLVGDDTIAFRYIWTTYSDTNWRGVALDPELLTPLEVAGQAVRFTSDSNFAAVWDAEQITIVILSNREEWSVFETGYGRGLRVDQIAHIPLTAPEDGTLPVVQWSADGTTLAWHDGAGISLWNVFDASAPTHLDVDAGNALIDVSQHGRYVRYGTPTDWTLLDTQTDTRYPMTIVSPDERFLGIVESAEEATADCAPPLRSGCMVHIPALPWIEGEHTTRIYSPYRENLIIRATCPAETPDTCYYDGVSWTPAIGATSRVGGRLLGFDLTDLRQIAYDPQYSQPALVIGDYMIALWFYGNHVLTEPRYQPYLDLLRLDAQLDSPIAHIAWGQPVFYSPTMETLGLNP